MTNQSGNVRDVAADFLYVMGLEVNAGWKVPVDQNKCLCCNMIETKRILNGIDHAGLSQAIQSQELHLANLCDMLSYLGVPSDKDSYFTEKERRKILDHYADENSQIAKEFLNRMDGVLFCSTEILSA